MILTSELTLQKSGAYLNRLAIDGAAITAAQRTAVTALATAIDGIGAAKFKAIYPFLGGTASRHALDMLAAYPITWAGTVTHDANGITGNGTTGYGDTGFNPSTGLASIDACGFSVYSRLASTPAGLYHEMGCTDGTRYFALGCRRSDNNAILNAFDGASLTVNGLTKSGLFTGTRRGSSDKELYRNGVSVGTATTASVGTINRTVYVLAMNSSGTPSGYSNNNLALAAIHLDLSDTEALTLYTAVQAYQTALGRQI